MGGAGTRASQLCLEDEGPATALLSAREHWSAIIVAASLATVGLSLSV